MNVHVRAARPSDVPLILQLIRELAEYEKLLHEVVATEEAFANFLFGDRPAAEVLIGECDGESVGLALFFQTFSTFLARPGLYLEDLYVRPAYRHRGIGKRLLAELATLALERGCGRLEWSVLDWNAPAIAFYRHIGAVAMDGWTVNRVTGDALGDLAKQKATDGGRDV